mmetsp:Transcript_8943/g.22126  ORF Transcript_8943/g.22126 Transcript_8943/m.22126 type:complete len:228 (+) Transcript_8943:886-1569(+)
MICDSSMAMSASFSLASTLSRKTSFLRRRFSPRTICTSRSQEGDCSFCGVASGCTTDEVRCLERILIGVSLGFFRTWNPASKSSRLFFDRTLSSSDLRRKSSCINGNVSSSHAIQEEESSLLLLLSWLSWHGFFLVLLPSSLRLLLLYSLGSTSRSLCSTSDQSPQFKDHSASVVGKRSSERVLVVVVVVDMATIEFSVYCCILCLIYIMLYCSLVRDMFMMCVCHY